MQRNILPPADYLPQDRDVEADAQGAKLPDENIYTLLEDNLKNISLGLKKTAGQCLRWLELYASFIWRLR